jgi:phage-related protein
MWSVEFLSSTVVAEYLAQPQDIQARLERMVSLITAKGIDRLHEPHAKHLQGPLWELRLQGRDGIARAIYVTRTGRRVVILRVFTKKTQKTPRSEIELALKRAKEVR